MAADRPTNTGSWNGINLMQQLKTAIPNQGAGNPAPVAGGAGAGVAAPNTKLPKCHIKVKLNHDVHPSP